MKVWFGMFVLLIGLSLLAFAEDVCEDGTPAGECSSTSPGKRCSYGGSEYGWVLEDAAKICGCPEGYEMQVTDDAPAGKCVALAGEETDEEETDQTNQTETYMNVTTNQSQANQTAQNATQTAQNQTNQTTGTGTQTVVPGNGAYVYEPIEQEEGEGGTCLLAVFIPLLVLGLAMFDK